MTHTHTDSTLKSLHIPPFQVDKYGRPASQAPMQHSVVNLDCWHRGFPYLFCNPIIACFKTDKVEWVRMCMYIYIV